MGDFSNWTDIKTRATHSCAFCHHEIPKGSEAGKQTGRWDGRFYTIYYHWACGIATSDGEYVDGLPGPGDMGPDEYLARFKQFGLVGDVLAFWPTIEQEAEEHEAEYRRRYSPFTLGKVAHQ